VTAEDAVDARQEEEIDMVSTSPATDSAVRAAPRAGLHSRPCTCSRCQRRRQLALKALVDDDLFDSEVGAPSGSVRLSASVGAGGANRPADGMAVQTLLNKFIVPGKLPGVEPLTTDGKVGARTIAAIRAFQQRFLAMAKPDGRVDPGGRTLGALNGSILQQPASTAGTPVAGGGAATGCTVQAATARCGDCVASERRLHTAPKPTLAVVPSELGHQGRSGIRLDAAAAAAYRDMVQAARAEGIRAPFLQIVSGHRDYDHQARLWRGRLLGRFRQSGCSTTQLACIERAIDRTSAALRAQPMPHGRNAWLDRFLRELRETNCGAGCDPTAQVRALRVGTAPPGRSPHHTGRAIDIHVGGGISTAAKNVAFQREQPSYRWLVCNAARFGFHPYNREPWHWEYNP
jgi:peptidoglycan hydrolase-like protein with peptidoglycan-binding domain